jgi:DinB family protein
MSGEGFPRAAKSSTHDLWKGLQSFRIPRLRASIYNPLDEEHVMEYNLEKSIALIARTPAVLDTMLRDLPDEWTMRNEGEKSWSAYDIVGHLIHGELTDWLPRARRILEHGESKPFDRFDRTAQERESKGKSLGQLLDEFARLRTESVRQLRAMNLSAADLAKRGRHPALGVVTLSQLLASWPVHDLTHLHQLSRVMAHQYREAIGPWTVYMGVMQCQGHSS